MSKTSVGYFSIFTVYYIFKYGLNGGSGDGDDDDDDDDLLISIFPLRR